MKQKNRTFSSYEVKTLFEIRLPRIAALASESGDESIFKNNLSAYLASLDDDSPAIRNIARLIGNDGKSVHELSTGREIRIETISLLWRYLNGRMAVSEASVDFWTDLFHQFERLYTDERSLPDKKRIKRWMKRWPDGLNREVENIRSANKERIISLLVRKIERKSNGSGRFVFPEGIGNDEKHRMVDRWWSDHRFQLAMAVKSPAELNRMLAGSLSEETMRLYRKAREKGMPLFITPYYLTLLNPSDVGYDDKAIRSYVLYSPELVEAYGTIRAWEKEDTVVAGSPNAAGWLLPEGRNIHRRYPEVGILIPDSMGRACGGLCASCQRMYDFQSRRLNFDFEELKPKENWNSRLGKLMDYFAQDTQLCDILITGGDALMSRNSTLRNLLDAVYGMAVRKREENCKRPEGEKYAELQRVRLGTRLPVYLPMRIDDELIGILRDFKEKALAAGIRQFVVQTHFQSPLEVTPEARDAVSKILSTGWTVTNQLVFNVAASRRGHTARLRQVLNELGILCYYTFTVKGFDENYAVYAPISRSMQERCEEKAVGQLDPVSEAEFTRVMRTSADQSAAIRRFCEACNIPFIATDRSVLNLPGIGKSMTFALVGIARDGRRILEFDHDNSRNHSPIIGKMGKIYICENKSVGAYLRQLEWEGEDPAEYDSIWSYTEGETERRFPLFDYISETAGVTAAFSNLNLGKGRQLAPDSGIS